MDSRAASLAADIRNIALHYITDIVSDSILRDTKRKHIHTLSLRFEEVITKLDGVVFSEADCMDFRMHVATRLLRCTVLDKRIYGMFLLKVGKRMG